MTEKRITFLVNVPPRPQMFASVRVVPNMYLPLWNQLRWLMVCCASLSLATASYPDGLPERSLVLPKDGRGDIAFFERGLEVTFGSRPLTHLPARGEIRVPPNVEVEFHYQRTPVLLDGGYGLETAIDFSYLAQLPPNSIQILALSNFVDEPDIISSILKALGSQTTLHVILFSKCRVPPLNPVKDCPLERLEFLSYSSTDKTTLAGLQNHSTLKVVRYERSGFIGFPYLPKINSLSVFGSSIDKENVGEIARLTSLRELELDSVTDLTSRDLMRLSTLVNLESLQLRDLPDQSRDFAQWPHWFAHLIKNLRNLRDLKPAVFLDWEDFSEVARLPNLKRIDLKASILEDRDIERLKDCPVLEELILDGSQLSDSDLISLGAIKTLRILSVRETKVTSKGVQTFRGRRPSCELVVSLPVHAK